MPSENVTDDELNAALGGGDFVDPNIADDGDDGDGHVKLDAEGNKLDAEGNKIEPKKDADGNVIEPKKVEVDWAKEVNDLKSDFGRKLKSSEDQVNTLTGTVEKLLAVIEKGQQAPIDDDFDADAPIPLTIGGLMAEVKKVMGQEKQADNTAKTHYEDGYMGQVEKLGNDYDDNIHKHIVDRMFKEFNVRHSDNPLLDAQLNFRNAEAAILREVRHRRANPLDKNKGKQTANLGGSNASDQDNNAAAPVKFDSYAQEFIAATGMKEEDAQKALSGDMPMYLRGKVSV